MSKSTQYGADSYRILLYRNHTTELLLETIPGGFRLPVVTIPQHMRVAEQLTTAIKYRWELETYCLFTLPPSQSSCHAVLEAYGLDPKPSSGTQWMSPASLAIESLQDPNDFALIEASRNTLDRYRTGELKGAFGQPGWLPLVIEWVAEQAFAADLRLTGKFLQLNAGPSWSLIRFETSGPALWFKAVADPDVHEHSVTLKLASAFPEFLPRIVASRPVWNAWLALESEGTPLDTNSTEAAWDVAAESLALLQVSSYGRRFEFIEAGCKDLRPCVLVDLVDPFFDSMAQLMEKQTKSSPPPLSPHDLAALSRETRFALEELEEAGVPSTLGHLDLNAGNLLVSDARCVFLDWAEAYIGPPFFSFQYLLEYWRRLHKENLCHENPFLTSYLKHWTRFARPGQIARSLELASLLAVFAYAANGLAGRSPDSIRPETAGYLRSLVRRMKREGEILSKQRHVCVP